MIAILLAAAVILTRPALVERCADGDTCTVRGHGTIRMLGVDAPETKHPRLPVQRCGPEASRFTKRLVGQLVTLEFEGKGARPTRDRYGRALAYVRRASWGRSSRTFNLQLIEQGYSPAYTRFPFRRRDEFVAAEAKARERKRGIWSAGGCR